MIDHTGMPVSDIARATEFYLKALASLGISIIMEVSAEEWAMAPRSASAPSREAVDAFYRAAIAAGGKDNGPPGLRPHYHANYYGAFVLDFDGNNIEAVCHAPAPK